MKKMPTIVIEFNKDIIFTFSKYISNDDIRISTLTLIGKTTDGDCECIVNSRYIVKIDHRDIMKITYVKENVNV